MKTPRFINKDKPVMKPEQVRDISYTLRRYYVDRFHEDVFCDRAFCGGLILDLGGNRKSKRGLFDIDCYDGTVIYANISASKSPDTVTDAESLPFAPATFETVICSELLEHVYRPQNVLKEVFRTLKPGGTLLVCVPFMVGVHGDPYDYGRYTDSYWRRALDDIGYSNVEIMAQGAFFSVAYDMLRALVYGAISHWGTERRISIAMIGRALGLLKLKAIDLDNRTLSSTGSKTQVYTTGFGIKATKK